MHLSNKSLLVILFIIPFSNLFAQDFLKHTSKNDPKAKGLNFTINYPSSWIPLEPDRPNVVAKFFSERGKGMEALIVLIKKLPGVPDKKNIAYLRTLTSSSEYLQSLQGQNEFISGSSATKIENLPASTIKYYSLNRVLDNEIRSTILAYTIFYKDCAITLMFSTSGKTLSATKRSFEKFEPLFQSMATSFVLLNKY